MNIAAIWASSSDYGLIANNSIAPVVTLDNQDESCDYTLRDVERHFSDLQLGQLNKRGWVTQERYLATRQLGFAKSQVYWECHELFTSEEFSRGLPKGFEATYDVMLLPIEKPTVRFASGTKLQEIWSIMDFNYSSCAFTNLSDRVIALAGLAEHMRDKTKDVYLAGLSKRDLIYQLCWNILSASSRVSTYFAPSWTWLSVTGVVSCHRAYHDPNDKAGSLL